MAIDFKSYVFLTIFSVNFIAKAYLFIFLIYKGLKRPENYKKVLLLCVALFGSLVTDFAWILIYIRELFFPQTDILFVRLCARIAWGLFVIQYQSLSIFIESLAEKNYRLPLYQRILLCINILYILYIIPGAFLRIYQKRLLLELVLIRTAGFLVLVLFLTIFFVLKKINNNSYPKILKQQLIILLKYFVCPLALMQLFSGIYSFLFDADHYIVVGLVSIINTYFTCIFKVLRLRFLNFNDRVIDPHSFPFFKKFRQSIERLGNTSCTEQLEPIVQMAFKDIFNIDQSKTSLYFRQSCEIRDLSAIKTTREIKKTEQMIESVLINDKELYASTYESRILIYDEIVFTSMTNTNKLTEKIISFLDMITADVFIPIFKDDGLIACIVIERNARPDMLYSDLECDEMVLYATSLENIINMFQNHRLLTVVEREKKLQEELYLKHQEINQFKESLKTFNRSENYCKIGIISYTSYRRFVYLNQDAKDIVVFDLNTQQGHWLTQELLQIAKDVLQYKTTKTHHSFDERGAKIIIRAVPFLEKNNVLFMLYYPEIFDFIKQTQQYLTMPTDLDYLLYLETTTAGQLINALVPSINSNFIQFKICLLKLALGKKALLLDVPEDDLETLVHILHSISMREIVASIELAPELQSVALAKKLFGINKIYESSQESSIQERPLLESLHSKGTLFIKNIQWLPLELQEMLADYIKYGYFQVYKSDQKVASSVRIICSTRQNISLLVHENKFSKNLYHELNQAQLVMPPLADLSDEEYCSLVKHYAESSLLNPPLKELFELTDQEKKSFIANRLLSLKQLKQYIQQFLKQKSEQKMLPKEHIRFHAAYMPDDPHFIAIARLGKNALRDSKILDTLMKKFGSQTKVAEFLGVDRSAVYKRLKRFNLI